MSERLYHGMTNEEIRTNYYITFQGDEDPGDLKYINAKLSRLWQDASHFYRDTKSKLENYKARMRCIEETIELKSKKVDWKYITENKVLPTNERWSDKARDTAAFIEVRVDEKLKQDLDDIRNGISEIEDELMVWHEIRNNLRFIATRIDSASMNVAVEAKLSAREPGNIPQMPADTKEDTVKDVLKEKSESNTTEIKKEEFNDLPF